jgi:hypothetical protein
MDAAALYYSALAGGASLANGNGIPATMTIVSAGLAHGSGLRGVPVAGANIAGSIVTDKAASNSGNCP